jgi:Ca-activated chloride channel homolog
MNRKTALILAAAGALAAAAILLERRADPAAAPVAAPAPTTPATPDPTPIAVPEPAPGACGAAAPARHAVSFGHGTVSAALSSAAVLAREAGEIYMAIHLDVDDIEVTDRPPLSLAIVLDRSGSMHGDAIVHARQAATGIVSRLGPQDQVALVTYDDEAEVVVSLTAMDAAGKERMRRAIAGVEPRGWTNLHGGLVLGRDEVARSIRAGAINRVILLSDGMANRGITDTPTLARIAQAAADTGVRITTIGLGLDYNEDLMERLADNGRGAYYYVRDADGLEPVFAGELRSLQATVATAAELRLRPDCEGVEILEVYGYDWRTEGDEVVIPMTDLFGGDQRKIVVRLRTPAQDVGQRGVVTMTLGYDRAQGEGRDQTAVSLGVQVSGDPVAVEASIDKDILAEALEVESARAMRAAADAYRRGEVAEAQRLNRQWRSDAADKAERFSLAPAAMAPMYDELDSQANGMAEYEPTSAGGRDVIKGSKVRARSMSKKR